MSAETKITCDGCGADLKYKSNSVEYRLVLASESKDMRPGMNAYTDMMIWPQLEAPAHFCGLNCLDLWRDRAKHKSMLWRDFNEAWKEEHGTKYEGGRVWSYPSPPEDLRKAKDAEFTAAAFDAFPMARPNHGGG